MSNYMGCNNCIRLIIVVSCIIIVNIRCRISVIVKYDKIFSSGTCVFGKKETLH